MGACTSKPKTLEAETSNSNQKPYTVLLTSHKLQSGEATENLDGRNQKKQQQPSQPSHDVTSASVLPPEVDTPFAQLLDDAPQPTSLTAASPIGGVIRHDRGASAPPLLHQPRQAAPAAESNVMPAAGENAAVAQATPAAPPAPQEATRAHQPSLEDAAATSDAAVGPQMGTALGAGVGHQLPDRSLAPHLAPPDVAVEAGHMHIAALGDRVSQDPTPPSIRANVAVPEVTAEAEHGLALETGGQHKLQVASEVHIVPIQPAAVHTAGDDDTHAAAGALQGAAERSATEEPRVSAVAPDFSALSAAMGSHSAASALDEPARAPAPVAPEPTRQPHAIDYAEALDTDNSSAPRTAPQSQSQAAGEHEHEHGTATSAAGLPPKLPSSQVWGSSRPSSAGSSSAARSVGREEGRQGAVAAAERRPSSAGSASRFPGAITTSGGNMSRQHSSEMGSSSCSTPARAESRVQRLARALETQGSFVGAHKDEEAGVTVHVADRRSASPSGQPSESDGPGAGTEVPTTVPELRISEGVQNVLAAPATGSVASTTGSTGAFESDRAMKAGAVATAAATSAAVVGLTSADRADTSSGGKAATNGSDKVAAVGGVEAIASNDNNAVARDRQAPEWHGEYPPTLAQMGDDVGSIPLPTYQAPYLPPEPAMTFNRSPGKWAGALVPWTPVQRRALLVANSAYSSDGKMLRTLLPDVQALVNALHGKGFTDADIMFLHNHAPAARVPTTHNVLNAVRWLVSPVQQPTSLLLVWAGPVLLPVDDVSDVTLNSFAGYQAADQKSALALQLCSYLSNLELPTTSRLHCVFDTVSGFAPVELPHTAVSATGGWFQWQGMPQEDETDEEGAEADAASPMHTNGTRAVDAVTGLGLGHDTPLDSPTSFVSASEGAATAPSAVSGTSNGPTMGGHGDVPRSPKAGSVRSAGLSSGTGTPRGPRTPRTPTGTLQSLFGAPSTGDVVFLKPLRSQLHYNPVEDDEHAPAVGSLCYALTQALVSGHDGSYEDTLRAMRHAIKNGPVQYNTQKVELRALNCFPLQRPFSL